jgi:hypothetical protein
MLSNYWINDFQAKFHLSLFSPSYTTVLHDVFYGLAPPFPWPQACLIMLCSVILMGLCTLLKMLMIDPPSPAGNPGMSLLKLFLAGNTSGISGFPGIFRS